jgi:hypothetical protein
MSRRFAIGIRDTTEAQRKALREYFIENGSWWNWITNFWLVTTDEDVTASELRDKILEITPGAYSMVIEVSGEGTWSGFGPKSEKRNMFNWMNNTWEKEK